MLRRLTEPMEIGGRLLPAGVNLAPCIYLVHRRPDVYPDPYAFRPERFLERPAGTYTWIPFGGGVRRCLGASFALFEMRVVLRELVRRLELRATDARPERVARRAITLVPERGGEVVVERVSRPAAARRGGVTTRKERQARTRAALMDAAADVAVRRGIEGASVDEVAERAGFTKGAVYANFASKEELFLAMLDVHFDARLAELDRILATDADPDDQAREAAEGLMRRLADEPEWHRLFFEFSVHAARNESFRVQLVERYRAPARAPRGAARAPRRAARHRAGRSRPARSQRWRSRWPTAWRSSGCSSLRRCRTTCSAR